MVKLKPDFWKDKSVLITGHTGFKGAWLSLWLDSLGARVCGYATKPPTKPSLFELAAVDNITESTIADIRDYSLLVKAFKANEPEIVFHLAAQSLVRPSYDDPVETFSTNLMGTVHLLEAIRNCESVKSVVIVTSDKCYENNQWVWGYRENDPLGGYDPYSSSKACKEILTASYRRSFFNRKTSRTNGTSIASARAGNVIGGGDWATDRLVPDMIKAAIDDRPAVIRNPLATRPWQHVLEPLCGYITLAECLYEDENDADQAWNFGPDESNVRSVNDVCDGMVKRLENAPHWEQDTSENPHEAHLLKLDSAKARRQIGWKTILNFEETLDWTAQWYQGYIAGKDGRELTMNDIDRYQKLITQHQKDMAT
ncbi:MAG: CDP-glucose 4,6-dehydratase [Phycisphaerae bacterium]|nr:CDP-glucose 4,6-dehydratase [Phycisphaerae bacterium]